MWLEAVAGLQPILACRHVSSLKIAHCRYLPVCSMHCLHGFPWRTFLQQVRVQFFCDLGYEGWSQKTRMPGLTDKEMCIILWSLALMHYQHVQGDHSPDNMKFPDDSLTFPWLFTALLPMLSVTHIMPVLLLLSVVRVEMQQCMMMIRYHILNI